MRIKGLDFLRGIAILLVLVRHGSSQNSMLYQIGWAGVDLFFVLSGFLVSGLLFKEYLAKRTIDFKLFLIRRGLKIYPPFYFFILVSIVLLWISKHETYAFSQILSEVLYAQSYFKGMWLHTWSLAVEEHFYIGLTLLVFLFLKVKRIENQKFMILFLVLLLLLSFGLRFYTSFQHIEEIEYSFTQTHLRLDGIVIGVLISYLYHFTDWYSKFKAQQHLYLVLAFLLISPLFFFEGGSFFMNTVGLTTINLGFGIIVLWSLDGIRYNQFSILKFIFLLICFVGYHSYSIYLWHLLSDNLLQLTVIDFSPNSLLLLSILISLAIGIFFSYTIERPVLKWRDGYFTKT